MARPNIFNDFGRTSHTGRRTPQEERNHSLFLYGALALAGMSAIGMVSPLFSAASSGDTGRSILGTAAFLAALGTMAWSLIDKTPQTSVQPATQTPRTLTGPQP